MHPKNQVCRFLRSFLFSFLSLFILFIYLFIFLFTEYIEDICFFEVNTKYISSSELKTSEFSRVRSTSENFNVSNSRDEIYLVFTEKKSKFSFYFIH